ncbi:hypothetical protein [Nevskia ramosa]|uniref:hypothetical protein n=1 Tax=Nevskia ramosa TaxID=64002 RepID=UPI002355543A|nr:hypothetical protein [Nevskia ramosa]
MNFWMVTIGDSPGLYASPAESASAQRFQPYRNHTNSSDGSKLLIFLAMKFSPTPVFDLVPVLFQRCRTVICASVADERLAAAARRVGFCSFIEQVWSNPQVIRARCPEALSPCERGETIAEWKSEKICEKSVSDPISAPRWCE